MAYRYDKDLEFLSKCTDQQLSDLVYLLTHDKDGKARWTEKLTGTTAYKRHHPRHSLYWEEIAAEIQCFGANTFATLFRGGKGVLYKEVLSDACDKLKVNYNAKSSVAAIEQNMLMKLLEQAIDSMKPDEINELATELKLKDSLQSITGPALTAACQGIFRLGGFMSYRLTVIIVNAVMKALIGRGLSLAANALMMRTASMLVGPIGWVLTGLWTAIDVAGTAYRVTIPAVVQVAFLRAQMEAQKAGYTEE